MTVSDNTIAAKGLGHFCKCPVKKELNAAKKIAKNVLKNQGRALEIGANVRTAFASQSLPAVLSSLPEMINFCYTGKRLYLVKFL